jgi:effector-binding domain-containing protein
MEPRIVERAEQPYVAVSGLVTMGTVSAAADRIPDLFGWLGTRGIVPAGAPFLKYTVIDMDREMEIEAGVPVTTPVAGAGDVFGATLPGGRYATVTHVGSFDGLVAATAGLLAWAERQGLAWDMTPTPAGERWGCRLEVYRTNPAEEPDPDKWETDLVLRLAQ